VVVDASREPEQIAAEVQARVQPLLFRARRQPRQPAPAPDPQAAKP
jgi:hypothetical protein